MRCFRSARCRTRSDPRSLSASRASTIRLWRLAAADGLINERGPSGRRAQRAAYDARRTWLRPVPRRHPRHDHGRTAAAPNAACTRRTGGLSGGDPPIRGTRVSARFRPLRGLDRRPARGSRPGDYPPCGSPERRSVVDLTPRSSGAPEPRVGRRGACARTQPQPRHHPSSDPGRPPDRRLDKPQLSTARDTARGGQGPGTPRRGLAASATRSSCRGGDPCAASPRFMSLPRLSLGAHRARLQVEPG
jgi:hypothetical protein